MIQHLHDYIPVNSLKELSVYQQVLDNTAIIILADANRDIIYVNQKFCDTSGYKRDDVLGKPLDSLRDASQPTEVLSECWSKLAQGEAWRGELLNKKQKEKVYWEEAVIYPFMDDLGKPYQYLSVGSDITPFKNALQIKDQFMANMSHELRTPLHTIFSLTNLLEETRMTDEQSNYVENILNATDILMRMVEDMLDLNKIENGEIKLERKIFSPRFVVDSLAKIFTEKAREKKLDFTLHFDEQIPEFVLGDPFRLKQILMHLLENAVKYTQNGQIVLDCSSHENQVGRQAAISFTIKDTGIGIASQNLQLIQEKFQQEKMDNKRVFQGQGLGLSIVKQLVELQQGEIDIQSRENEGTRVCFTLVFPHPSGEPKEKEDDSVPDEPASISHMKVLIAEDVDINQLVIKKHMQKFGFDADFAENGKIALEKLRQKHYDIVLMDMQMPVMDGYEAIQVIRNEFQEPVNNVPIISITASVLGEAPRKCIEAGANDYVPKPYNIRDLRKKMEEWVGVNQKSVINNIESMEKPEEYHQDNKEHERQSLIDLEYLKELSEGDDDFTISMLSYFIENTPDVLRGMKQFYSEENWKSLRNVAHKFKPQLTFMGIKSIFEDVETIEQNAAHETNTETIPSLVEKVEKVCHKAMEEIKTELEKLLDKNQ